MSYPINYPTPQGADIQIFSDPNATASWVKPQGASFVWFTLIGAGGGGGGSDALGPTVGGGGGSGAVTNCLVPAFLIPDVLRVFVGLGGARGPSGGQGAAGTASTIVYQQKDTAGYTLLTANGGAQGQTGANGTGGAATNSGFFSAAGFFSSVAGVSGTTGATVAPATTFLTGGSASVLSTSVTNYGYAFPTTGIKNGFFQLQPIIVGIGGAPDISTFNGGRGGTGCGGGGADATGNAEGGRGGDGLVVIISW